MGQYEYGRRRPTESKTMDIISRKDAKAQGLKHFYTGVPCRHGHDDVRFVSSGACKTCRREVVRGYNARNPEKAAKWSTAGSRRFAENHPVRDKQQKAKAARKYAKANIKKRETQQITRRQRRRAEDPNYDLLLVLRARMAGAFRGQRKPETTKELLGCSIEKARKHIESQFQPGMTWENRGLYGWHIDHIRPVASFADPCDPACWHYTNLQPLWAKDNRAKSDSWNPAAA